MQIPGEMLDRTDRVGANVKKVSTNVISFLEKVSKDYLIFDMVTFHCFCLLMLSSVWLRLLTYRSCLIYFILFYLLDGGQALCKLWTAFSVNQNI